MLRARIVFFALVFAGVVEAQGVTNVQKCQIINTPGSYALARDLTSQGDCLTIFSGNVTIDLSGFSISGTNGGNAVTDLGIGRQGVTIKNGRLTNFSIGINLVASSVIRIENIDIIAMTGDGIDGGRGTSVCNTHVLGYGTYGMNLGDNAVVTNSTVDNTGTGSGTDTSGAGSRFQGNTGINAGNSALITGNTSNGNLLVGISAGVGSQLTNNISIGLATIPLGAPDTGTGNGFAGISVACPSNLVGNMANTSIFFQSGTKCTLFNNN